LLALLGLPTALPAALRRATIDPTIQVLLSDGGKLYLEATPRRGEGLIVFARRLCDTSSAAPQIAEANGGTRTLKTGLRYRVPYEVLSPELQLRAIQALFRADRPQPEGWRHVAKAPIGLWHLARWFTGRGENFAAVREANRLKNDSLAAGQAVVIPAHLLLPAFRSQLPEIVVRPPAAVAALAVPTLAVPTAAVPTAAVPTAAAATPTASVAEPVPAAPVPALVAEVPVAPAEPTAVPALDPQPSDGTDLEEVEDKATPVPSGATALAPDPPATVPPAGPVISAPPVAPTSVSSGSRSPIAAGVSSVAALLRYGKDEQGAFAVYPLKAGEALYSSVVVRLTGRIYADDVNSLAAEIARRSAIRDVTDIPIGFPVKIPMEHLLPEFLPADHPRRLEYEAGILASEGYRQRWNAAGLEGVTVILDPGHGGRDVGAMVEGVREATYVYDIAVRVKRLLETYTRARVAMTTRDGKEHRLQDADILAPTQGHAVLTTPPYPIADSKIGVHLRWFLANSVFRQTARRPDDSERVVFLSLHADSLHPSLRGAMAYIPDAHGEVTRTPFSGVEFARRKEVREQPRSVASRAELQRSAGLSRQFAEELIGAMRDVDLAVHPFKPIRDRIVRGRRPWVPAVLKYNTVPARTLFEVCNLNNPQDRALLQTRAYRQKIAEAVVAALSAYYGPDSKASTTTLAARR
jgi:N-acetylmuramoyl-L-alanine amidase